MWMVNLFIIKMSIHRIVPMSTLMLQYSRSNTLIKRNFREINKYRFATTDRSKHTKALKTEKEKFRTYVVQRYIDYVKNYTKVLENRFPTAVKMYRVFSVGITDFLRDLKTYISLRIRISRDQGFANMSRQEIELYQKMPSDMWRIAPVLILSAIPFGNYIIFPLAFLKPKSLLCSHFWSIQQRLEFSMQDLTERLKNNKPVFRALQAKLDMIPNNEIKEKWRRVLALLGSGVHPTPNDVLECKELFVKEPYQLESLPYAHAGHLLKMHGLRRSIFRRNKLKYRAFLLLEMDKAIIREGGVDKLTMETLRYACHIRGLNGSHLSNNDMRDWLQKWLMVSENVDKQSYSLLLHSPIFFAYNHPQNWVLIY
ncbi:LETM1 domain-containing protein 1 [Achroia grisella]|uniref:LETM1 domain-containing protein 1 n=1 Tax=Achroia grisella TaxID=688607 RepID=UPI0027D23F37|nr:LETM1 domain-containing protein 1 [Achroia grisella]